jgi:histidinol-phosphate aminotransferase
VPGVRGLKPYQPGKPISELEREYGVTDIIKLASNENPLGPGPRAVAAMKAASGELARYPDANGFELKQAIAARHGVPVDRITLGNGSNDVLVLLAEAFLQPGAEAVFSEYAFAVYPIATQAAGAVARVAPPNPWDHHQPLGHDLDAMAARINERTRIVFIANPNNPTGTWLDAEALGAFIDAVPEDVLVVVDEAYAEYQEEPGYPDCTQWLDRYPNLVVTRTFSKAFGLAGLRIGYALSHPGVADILNRVRQPFNVSLPAQAAAVAALGDDEHLSRSIRTNNTELARVTGEIERTGLRFVPSVCNFLLVDFGRDAGPVYEALLRRSVIVRPVGNYGLGDCLRISIGTPEENTRLINALGAVLADAPG